MIEPTYDPTKIIVPEWPAPQPAGEGWWRIEWTIEYDPDETREVPRFPTPPHEWGNRGLLVGLVPIAAGRLRLEVLSRHERLHPHEIGFISTVLDSLRESLRPRRVNGHERSLILHP
jgi:hypothetical protein